MKRTQPPRDFDLPTIMFAEQGHIPPSAVTSDLVAVRDDYNIGEVVPRLQLNALKLDRALMFAAQYSENLAAKQFARKYAAITLFCGAWHSIAEERPQIDDDVEPYLILGEDERGVTRRRLKLIDFSRIPKSLWPSTAEMHEQATNQLGECISLNDRLVREVHAGKTNAAAETNWSLGRLMGNTALLIAAAPIGDIAHANRHLEPLEIQVGVLQFGQQLRNRVISLSSTLGKVAAPSLLAEPMGSALSTQVVSEMPRPLADHYQEVQSLLPAA